MAIASWRLVLLFPQALSDWLHWHAISNTLTPANNYGSYGPYYGTTLTVASADWGSGGGWGNMGGWGTGAGPILVPVLVPNTLITLQKKKKRKVCLRQLREERAATQRAFELEQARLEIYGGQEWDDLDNDWYSSCSRS